MSLRALLVAAAGTTLVLGTLSQSAQAVGTPVVETFNRPAGTTITLAGHGFGHGRGLSQWGAYGAAQRGLTYPQILAFYYPGTTRVWQGNPALRIQLSSVGTSGTRVASADGLTFSDGTTRLTLSTAPKAWRVIREGSGLTLQWQTGATTWASSTKWKAWTASPLDLSNPKVGRVRVALPSGTLREYRGTIRTRTSGTGTMTVNHLSMEPYLWSVVPSEMPALWTPAAVQSQAVAARTYASNEKASKPSTALFDTCDTTACQVYKGVADYTSTGTLTSTWEHPAATDAVSNSAGIVLHHNGSPAFTQFSASNGGWSVASSNPSQPYLVAKLDPYDGVPTESWNPHSWSITIPISRIESAYGLASGTFRRLEIPTRTGHGEWGGRIVSARVVGSLVTKTTTGPELRTKLGLRSEWFAMSSAPAASSPTFPKDLTADTLADLLAVDSSGNLVVLKNNDAGSFTRVTAARGWQSQGLVAAIGTFESDNRGDVVARDASGNLWLYRGTSTGALTQGVRLVGTGWGNRNLIVPTGDFDGDRHTDFLARGTDGVLRVYRGDGAGAILGATYISNGWGGFRWVFSPGDLTGDGTPDVLAVSNTDGRMYRYTGNGTGGFASRTALFPSTDWRFAKALWGVGDLTKDGRADVVAHQASTGDLLIYPGTGTGTISLPTVRRVPAPVTSGVTRWGQ